MDKHINCSIKIPKETRRAKKHDGLYLIEKTEKLRSKTIAVTSHKEQYDCLLKLYQDISYNDIQTYQSEIKGKLNGYKHQDREKRRDIENIISFDDIIAKLIASKLKCYYCKGDVNILYSNVKQDNQWTLERINNDIGHTNDNCEICCLKCNLKRRCMPSYLYKNSKEIGNVIKLCD